MQQAKRQWRPLTYRRVVSLNPCTNRSNGIDILARNTQNDFLNTDNNNNTLIIITQEGIVNDLKPTEIRLLKFHCFKTFNIEATLSIMFDNRDT